MVIVCGFGVFGTVAMILFIEVLERAGLRVGLSLMGEGKD
jgi:hypothetical protein